MVRVKRYLALGGAILAATTWASAQSGAASDRPYAVDADGNIYLALKDEDRLVRIDRDGREETLASALDAPSALKLDSDGNVLVSDMTGTKRVNLQSRTVTKLAKSSKKPNYFIKVLKPSSRSRYRWWSYVQIEFAHNLPVSKARFDVEASFDGGRSWFRIGSRLHGTRHSWRVTPTAGEVLLRVTGYVRGAAVTQELSSFQVEPTGE